MFKSRFGSWSNLHKWPIRDEISDFNCANSKLTAPFLCPHTYRSNVMISLTKHDFLAHLLEMCNFLKHDFLARPKRYTLRWRRRRDAHDRQQVAEQVCSKTFEPFSETPENTHYRRDQEIVHAAEESWVWNRPAYETFRSRLDCGTAPTAAKWNSNFLIGRVDRKDL